jgi:hypothetical protein
MNNTIENNAPLDAVDAPLWQEPFLKALAETCNVTLSARAAGISRQCAYQRKAECDEFSSAWDDAIEQAVDLLQAAAWQRAMAGTAKDVFHAGEKVGEIREYSDTLTIFFLKAHRYGYGQAGAISNSIDNRKIEIVLPPELAKPRLEREEYKLPPINK